MDISKLTKADIEWLKFCIWFMKLSSGQQDEFCNELEKSGVSSKSVAIIREAGKKAKGYQHCSTDSLKKRTAQEG